MPRCPTLHSYVKAQTKKGRRGILADDPSVHYLLGFEKDNVDSLPVKMYIRRLWLAFESSKHSSVPRCFLDPRAERFSKEVEACVSDFVEDEDRLTSEIAKDPLVVDEKTKETRSAFLEDTARALLVTGEWGDHLWGSRTFCRNPLVNAKREPGDNEPPEWPRDEDFIVQTVRYWLAARLQDKLRNPRQVRRIPRVECPEDPDQRRVSLAAVFPGTVLYDSEEEAADLVAREAVDVVEGATQSQRHEEYPLRRTSTRRRRPSARAIDIGGLRSTCTDTPVTRARPKPSAAPSQSPDEHLDNVKLNTAVPRAPSVTPSSLKRKQGVKNVMPSRTTSNTRLKSAGPLLTPTPSLVVSQVPFGSAHGSSDRLNTAPVHDGSDGLPELLPPTKYIVAEDHSHPERGLQVADVTQRRAAIFVDPQDPCRQSVDIEPDFFHNRNDEGSCETHRPHDGRAAPCPSTYECYISDDRGQRKNNNITARNSVSRVLSAATKRDTSKPFVCPCGESTTRVRVLEGPGPSKAVHKKRFEHVSESTVVHWKRRGSDRRGDHTVRATTPSECDLDIDFALLGDPKADEPHEDSF